MNLYEQLSEERKKGQAEGIIPEWMSTNGYSMFKQKYLYQADSPKEQFERIALTAAKYAPSKYLPEDGDENKLKSYQDYWKEKFFDVLWKGYVACSTPVLANMGTSRGCSVSCAATEIEDSIDGFYRNAHEVAMLTKEGFGTATDLSSVRPRGATISVGGTANGVLPVIQMHIQLQRDVAQGTARRGAWAGCLNIEHGDFWEVVQYLEKHPDDFNLGWIVHDSFIEKLNNSDEEASKRYKRALKVKMMFGKGYFMFIDKVNRKRPKMYVDNNLKVKTSQLCQEILLHCDAKNYTYTCVLAWMNLSKYDDWKNTDAVEVATIFLDCVVSNFIEQASNIPGLSKAVASTIKGRAVGLGAGGYHTYLQEHMIPFESLEAQMWNIEVFRKIDKESLKASKWLALVMGEPDWCKGYGVRSTHRMAVAPTKSTAAIYGGISEGISPDVAMSFTAKTAAGNADRVNPPLLALIKRKGLDVEKCIHDVAIAYGSVQGVEWLTQEEKEVFKTAFEINQKMVLRKAAARQKYIDQGQSLSLYLSKDASEEFISDLHQEAFLNENIMSLYYIYSSRGVVSSSSECTSCQ